MNRPFATLSVEEQLAVREAQKRSKQLKKTKKQQAKQEKGTGDQPLEHDGPQRCVVTQDEYFSACPHGCFRDPSLPPRAASLDLLLRALEAGDEQAADLNKCCYFQFSGPERALWDPEFNARLAWEGFFTITTGRGGRIEPLPELQPFYGVLLFKHFEASKHVRDMLAQLARQRRGYRVSNDADPDRTWRHIEEYHKQRHSSNWLTRRYFEMMRAASDDPAINFTLNCIELTVDASGAAAEGGVGGVDGVADAPLVISVGSRARVDGLVGRSDLNGREARVLDFDVTAGRWSVEVALQCGGVERVRVKPANLTAVPPPPSPIAGEIGFTVGGVPRALTTCSAHNAALPMQRPHSACPCSTPNPARQIQHAARSTLHAARCTQQLTAERGPRVYPSPQRYTPHSRAGPASVAPLALALLSWCCWAGGCSSTATPSGR